MPTRQVSFLCRLAEPIKAAGVTPYRIAKDLGMSHNTAARYARGDVVIDRLDGNAILIAEYLGIDWREVVEVLIDGDEIADEDADGQTVTPLAVAIA